MTKPFEYGHIAIENRTAQEVPVLQALLEVVTRYGLSREQFGNAATALRNAIDDAPVGLSAAEAIRAQLADRRDALQALATTD